MKLRFKYAFEGLLFLIRRDRNFKLHLIFLVLAIITGFFFQISAFEWIAILICSALVLCLEGANSVIERIADFVHAEKHPEIKIIKDVAAGTVLLAALFSIIVACIIFIPKINLWLNH